MKAEMAMALNRAQTACLHRHRREWDRAIPEVWTREQIEAVRHALKNLAADMDKCDPHTIAKHRPGKAE